MRLPVAAAIATASRPSPGAINGRRCLKLLVEALEQLRKVVASAGNRSERGNGHSSE